jgi:phosphoglycerate dehydrogenase-like enzyme
VPAIRFPSVIWFHNGGVGVDHLQPWETDRVTVTNCAGVLAPFLAETVLGAMIMLNFGFHRYLRHQAARRWQQLSWRPLAGRTILVVGLGNIGRAVARKAKEQGMRVLGVRNSSEKPPEVDELRPLSRLHESLAEADFVSLHVPLTGATHHLIDREALAAMRPESFLINAARGPVVEETALIKTLEAKRIAGAYLDVFETEPLPPESPLWDFENVIISPHASDLVEDWDVRFARFFAANLERWMEGDPLKNIVDPARGY